MSTNNECLFVEVKPGEWYYLLEHYNAPKNAWDWRENADCYGPFKTQDVAANHLRDNHANPGGYSKQPFEVGVEPDDVLAKLIKEAKSPKRRQW